MNQDHTQKSKDKGNRLIRAAGILFLVAGIVVLGYGIKWFLHSSSIKNWPTTTGVIISSGTKWQQTRMAETPTLIADVIYQYEVNGIVLKNDDISASQFGSSNVEHARTEAAKYPIGSEVTVYYDPDNPASSYLQSTIGWLYLIAVAVGIAALFTGFFLLRQNMADTSSLDSSVRKADPSHQRTASASQPHKYNQNKMIVLGASAGILAVAAMLYQNYTLQNRPNNTHESAQHLAENHAPSFREAEKSIVHILELLAQAQIRYKTSTGSYTKNLHELTLPEGYLPRPADMGSLEIDGYLFRIVPQNGTSAMDYQRDFVISAIPVSYHTTGNNSFAVGPKAIVIFADNHGEAVTNAVTLRYWKPYPRQ